MTPRVTIGIPCYNAGRWIEACVRSALAQDWPDKEVIVVDDGSTDQSLNILRGFGEAIHLVKTEHRGANHARNEILRRATGEWIQYLDADDYLLPEKISRQFAEASDGDVIYSPVWIENAATGSREVGEIDPQFDIYAQWLSWQLPQTGACLWRKSPLAGLRGWNEAQPCCQEHELYLRAIQAGGVFKFAPTPNAVYRIWSDETLCRKDPVNVVEEKTQLLDAMLAWMEQRKLLQKCHRAVAGRAFFKMSRTLAKYDLEKAAHYFDEKKARGLVHPEGPAAPLGYRIFLGLFGFRIAERAARAQRKTKQ